MKFCRAVESITDEDLNTITHMILSPSVLKEVVQRINETYQIVNIPEDISINFPKSEDNK